MAKDIPWRKHLIGGAMILLVLLLFQQVARGELTPEVAVVAALGYVLVSELVRRYRIGRDTPS